MKVKPPIIVYSTTNDAIDEYVVVFDGQILETYDQTTHDLLSVTGTYKRTYEPDFVVDIDNTIYDSTQDALDEYNASYSNLKPIDDNPIIINTPDTTGNTIMSKSSKDIRRTAKLQALAGVGVSAIAGPLHLVLQSAADSVPYVEGIIKTKLLKFDKTVDEIVERRERITKERQQTIVDIPSSFMDKVRAAKTKNPKVVIV